MKKFLIVALLLAFCGMALAETVVVTPPALVPYSSKVTNNASVAAQNSQGKIIVSAFKGGAGVEQFAVLTYRTPSLTVRGGQRIRVLADIYYPRRPVVQSINGDSGSMPVFVHVSFFKEGSRDTLRGSEALRFFDWDIPRGDDLGGNVNRVFARTETALEAGTYYAEVLFSAQTARDYSIVNLMPLEFRRLEITSY